MKETIEAALARLYPDAGRAVDDLPYTKEFDDLCEGVLAVTGQKVPHRGVWVTLMAMRKSKGTNKLPTRREGRRRERNVSGLGAF